MQEMFSPYVENERYRWVLWLLQQNVDWELLGW
jgi:hypothetical protein